MNILGRELESLHHGISVGELWKTGFHVLSISNLFLRYYKQERHPTKISKPSLDVFLILDDFVFEKARVFPIFNTKYEESGEKSWHSRDEVSFGGSGPYFITLNSPIINFCALFSSQGLFQIYQNGKEQRQHDHAIRLNTSSKQYIALSHPEQTSFEECYRFHKKICLKLFCLFFDCMSKELARGRVGLNNLGNTCFMNAATQVGNA